MDLSDLSTLELRRLLREGQVSPVEVTEAFLARIERFDGRLNSYVTVTADLARERARRREEELTRGISPGPAFGLPITLKDLIDTRGVRTTYGSALDADHVPTEDAAVTRKLDETGAILLGKLRLTEFALKVHDRAPHGTAPRNPRDPDRIPGGSSSGSAVAVAAGLCAGALGTDTGGSIRIPASLCGVVGLKPTFGRVSTRGVFPLSWSLDHVGPLARDVAGVAILLDAIAGYDPADPESANAPVESYVGGLDGGIDGWKVALAADDPTTSPEVREAVRRAATVFAELGATVEEARFDAASEAWDMYATILLADAAAVHRERLEAQPEGFLPDVRASLTRGLAIGGTEYARARRAQSAIRRAAESFFEGYGLLLLPTTPVAAPTLAEAEADNPPYPSLTRFTAIGNVAGIPSLSIPCGQTREGLPIGLQILGPCWSEARLLRAATRFEEAMQGVRVS